MLFLRSVIYRYSSGCTRMEHDTRQNRSIEEASGNRERCTSGKLEVQRLRASEEGNAHERRGGRGRREPSMIYVKCNHVYSAHPCMTPLCFL